MYGKLEEEQAKLSDGKDEASTIGDDLIDDSKR
jgi:hypothetical protein